MDKCVIYSPNAMTRTEVAAALKIPHRVGGLVIAGIPVGRDKIVAASAKTKFGGYFSGRQ